MVTIAYRGSAGKSGTLGADPAVDISAFVVNDDYLIAFGRAGGALAADGSFTALSGPSSNAGLWGRKWVTGDPTSWTFVTTGAVNSVVGIVAYSGVHTTSPVDDSDGITGTGAMVIPSVDSAGTNRLLAMVACKLQNTTFTFSAGTERFDALSSTQNFVYAGADEAIGSGATGSRTATPASGASNGVAYMVALRPATTEYTQSADLVGDGVPARDVIVLTMARNTVGDGVLSRQLGETTARDLTGDGVVSRQSGLLIPRNLVGDGVVTESEDTGYARSFDLTGDGVLTRGELSAGLPWDLTGDGTITEARQVDASRTFDLTGDGEITASRAGSLARSFDLEGAGIITEVHPVIASRTFDLTGVGEVPISGAGASTITIPIEGIPAGDCPSDWSPNDGLKAIAGTVLFHEPPNQGDPVSGAVVTLIRDSDGLRITTTTTAADGTYSFPRDTNDPFTYHVEVNWTDGGTPQQGLSEGGCVPS